jgi:transcription termination factor Rho
MDQLIFEEFKGTGNMELVLDRDLADRRIWPAVNISQSGTRKEERLLPEDWVPRVQMLRRHFSRFDRKNQMPQLLAGLAQFPTNAELLAAIGSLQNSNK